MTQSLNSTEIADRLKLIETMMTEGRRKTESWGWTFLLWGIAYYVAIGWAAFGSAAVAWPVTMIAATILTILLSARQSSRTAATTLARAVGSIWTGMGVSLFLLLFSMGFSHRFEQHIFVAIVGAMVGSANATSGLLLRWKAQFACAIVWWAAAVVACFGSAQLVMIVFLVAIFLCQIVFGIYAMLRDARARNCEARHA